MSLLTELVGARSDVAGDLANDAGLSPVANQLPALGLHVNGVAAAASADPVAEVAGVVVGTAVAAGAALVPGPRSRRRRPHTA